MRLPLRMHWIRPLWTISYIIAANVEELSGLPNGEHQRNIVIHG